MTQSKSTRKNYLQSGVLAAGFALIYASPALAGCLCNALSNYIDCGGTIMSVAFIVSAFLMFRRDNLAAAKKLVFAGAILVTITVAMCTSLNSNLWYSPGVIANSEAWLTGGVPAHWISLLIFAILFSGIFITCSMLPTVVAFRRKLDNRKAICNMNLMILLIPGAFVVAPALFFDLGSYFVMAFWSTLFSDPKSIAEIPSYFYLSIAVWSLLLGVFAFCWGKLLLYASEPEKVIAAN